MNVKYLLAAIAVVALSGCAVRSPSARATRPVHEPVDALASTIAVPVTVQEREVERTEWLDYDGPEDLDYTYVAYWSNGNRKSSWLVWNGGVRVFSHYDRRGRLRWSETDHLETVADLSRTKPTEIARETRSPLLVGVYIVGNGKIRDRDVLALSNDERIKWMIVERCPRVSRSTLRAIKSKLVSEFP